MTVRKNGADTGTLKTRMGFLIRWSGHHGMGGTGEGVAGGAVIPGRRGASNPEISRFRVRVFRA
jgi:hypothetical protein